jgi:hypothetical protein
MYFVYGWPKTLAVKSGTTHEDVVHISFTDDYLVIVSIRSVEIWSGGQHRIRLGHLIRDEHSVKSDGLYRQAVWCSSRRLLAILVSIDCPKAYLMQKAQRIFAQFWPQAVKRFKLYRDILLVYEVSTSIQSSIQRSQ